MKVCVIAVGIGQWEQYGKPLVDSIYKYEPTADTIYIDNGRRKDGKQDNIRLPYNTLFKGVFDIKVVDGESEFMPVSYARAMSHGLQYVREYLHKEHDWYIIINNDVLCTGYFFSELQKMDRYTVYGNKIHTKSKHIKMPVSWIDGWLYAIPNNVVDKIGYFDNNFLNAAFEDADYCIRAHKAGFKIAQSNLPFVHLEEHTRRTVGNFSKERRRNLEYLAEKHELKLL